MHGIFYFRVLYEMCIQLENLHFCRSFIPDEKTPDGTHNGQPSMLTTDDITRELLDH